MSIRRGYVDGPYGQVHFRASTAIEDKLPIVCLHATAYSSQSFLPLMRALDGERQVIALDVPGYGESDAPDTAPDLGGYARAIRVALDQMGVGRAIILGYHTGAYMASELAVQRPDLVIRLVLIGVPYFQALGVEEWRRKLLVKHRLDDGLGQFEERWRYFITSRHASVTLKRGFANFVDELKAWPNGWWAHQAMFDYDSDRRLPQVVQPVLILNPAGHLNPASRAAARLLPDARVVELPEVDGPILEAAPTLVAREIAAWLEPVRA